MSVSGLPSGQLGSAPKPRSCDSLCFEDHIDRSVTTCMPTLSGLDRLMMMPSMTLTKRMRREADIPISEAGARGRSMINDDPPANRALSRRVEGLV